MASRSTYIRREIQAGCRVCGGGTKWTSKNAQGVAARHHDATGHQTFVEVFMVIEYGDKSVDKNQTSLLNTGG